jgi:phenylpyruvate tautomerase PptA (4-oxalocrotonate tautomerase family)
MPAFICEIRSGLKPAIKAQLAREITDVVNEIIKSPFDLISVIFHDLREEDTYRSGKYTTDTLILGHIRKGRTDAAVQRLGLAISATWSRITGISEQDIEVLIQEYPAKFTFRGGERLPEPPIV